MIALWIPPLAFWPYFAGVVVFALGLTTLLRRGELSNAPGLEKALRLGPLIFAIPIAFFGAEHFIATKDIATGVPRWIPGHLFWTYLVGTALLAAALSIAVKRMSGPAATLLGIMLFCFVVLIHIPRLMASPGDRIAMAVVLRDLSFSAGALALATTRTTESWRTVAPRVATAARYVVAVAMLFFAVEHFLHPSFVPVVPLGLAMPAWIPLHWLWAYGVGAALLAAGLAMIGNWYARLATTCLGIVVFAVVLLVYLPILLAHPADIAVSANYFMDTLMVSGDLLVLASSMRRTAQAV